MACCWTDNVERKGNSVLSCFLKNSNTIYAVTCRHATGAAKHDFFVKDKSDKEVPIATKLEKTRSVPLINCDIDVIKVNADKTDVCKAVFRKGNALKRFRLYGGSVEDLLLNEKPVFKYSKAGGQGEFTFGEVLPFEEIPEVLRNSYSQERHFFVGNKDNIIFAQPGDSGRIVGLEADDGWLELVGIVVHLHESCTICLLLRSGLEFLEQENNMQLSLYESAEDEKDCCDELRVEPGETLTFIQNRH